MVKFNKAVDKPKAVVKAPVPVPVPVVQKKEIKVIDIAQVCHYAFVSLADIPIECPNPNWHQDLSKRIKNQLDKPEVVSGDDLEQTLFANIVDFYNTNYKIV